MKAWVPVIFSIGILLGCKPEVPKTPSEVIDCSVGWHAPNGDWNQKGYRLHFENTTPEKEKKTYFIDLDYHTGEFRYVQETGLGLFVQGVKKDSAYLQLNGQTLTDTATIKQLGGWDGSGAFWKGFFGYLYALPLNIQDGNAIIDSTLEIEKIDQHRHYKVKVTYPEAVGTHTWYFYFNTANCQLKAYDFYFDKEETEGERVLLENVVSDGPWAIPKVRKWYSWPDKKFLGKDDLIRIEELN